MDTARPAPEERWRPGAPPPPPGADRMPPPAPGTPGVSAQPRAAARRRWQHVGDAAVLLTCWLSTTIVVAYAYGSVPEDSTWQYLYVFVVWPVGLLLDAAVLLRRSRPVLACLVACGTALLLPLDAVAALVVLPWVLARSRPRVAWATATLVALATTVALVRDRARGQDAVLSTVDRVSGDHQLFPVLGYVVVGVLVLGIAVVRGVVQRMRLAVDAADLVQREQQRTVEDLRTELSTETIRQDERDLIARELHDTVAHHLSLVALRASALEVSSSAEVEDAARSVRATAHDALEEMRDLIGVLRHGHQVPGAAPGRTLVDIPTLVDTVRAGGADVTAIVYVSSPGAAPRPLTQAVYRIVQESLTNALKHAPGARIDLDLRAAPGFGVQLCVRNRVPDPDGHPVDGSVRVSPGSGTGLVGMRERATTVGGSVECGPVSDDAGPCWQVRARLPWPVDEPR